MKLYNANLSPNCLRVRAVALELGVELDIEEVNVFAGGGSTADFLALNPNGKVPVLVDDGFVLWESRAIMSYLTSKSPGHDLHPTDARKRALTDQWVFWQTVHLGPAMQKVAFERVIKAKFGMGEPDVALADAQMKEVTRCLKVLDATLSGREWVTGELSIADFALASSFMYREPAQISLESVPAVGAWIDRLEARESWKAAVAPLLAGVFG